MTAAYRHDDWKPESVMFYLADHLDGGRLQTLPCPGTG
jgi:hypothetical protein